MTTLIRLSADGSPWGYALRVEGVDPATFHAFIAALKNNIPPRQRKWSAEDRCWLLRDCDVAIGLLHQFGIPFECDEPDPEPEPTHRRLTTTAAYETLFLLPTAPDFLVQVVYRALAKKYHPDAGGSTEAMQRLNQAVEVLR